MLLLTLFFCLSCRVWTDSKVNYQFIFEFDTRHSLDWRQLSEVYHIASHCQRGRMLIMADTLTFGFSARSLCLVKLQHVWRAHDVYLLAGYFDIRNSINSLLPLAYAISSQPWMVCILIGESFRHHCSCSITNVYHSGASYWPVGTRSSFAISSLVIFSVRRRTAWG